MINRYFYKTSLSEFVKDSSDDIFGKIARNDEGDSVAVRLGRVEPPGSIISVLSV